MMEVGAVGIAVLWVAGILLVAVLGNADRRPRRDPPTVDELVTQATAEQDSPGEQGSCCQHAHCAVGAESWAAVLTAHAAYQRERSLLTLGPYRRAMDLYVEHQEGN